MNNPGKSAFDEFSRFPVDLQRRIRWTLGIAGGWVTFVTTGAAIFHFSKPYLDRKRQEMIDSGELVQDLQDMNAKYGIKRSYGPREGKTDDLEISPPAYLLEVIDDVVTEEQAESTS